MKKEKIYTYIGKDKSLLDTSILLEGATIFAEHIRLEAADGKILSNGVDTSKIVYTSEDIVDTWKEIDNQGQD